MDIDMEDMTAYIVQKTGQTEGIIDSILECEMEFLESKGLVGSGPDDPSLTKEPVFVDTDELEDFIVKKQGFLSRDVVAAVLEAVDEFMIATGNMDE
ncbi:hypothetical protein [Paenibacillus camerounensis]|uniref:hypothetical protein n=1 Tax=Paenibacillus camerounensis TaxID=1243663 RepID=UPI0005A78312|nr:hypothetical protein [Paenibacillus camerounensis]